MKNKERGSKDGRGSHPQTFPTKESGKNLPTNSRKYYDNSPFDINEYEDFTKGIAGERVNFTGLSKSLDGDGSEDYDHFVETPELIKRTDAGSKQGLKEAVLKQYSNQQKPPRNDNRNLKKKVSNFQMKTAREANSRQKKHQIFGNDDYSFDGYINQSGSSFSRNDMREPSSVIDEPSSIATTNKEYKQMLDRTHDASLMKTRNGVSYKDNHERIASYMNVSDSESLVQTSKGHISKYGINEADPDMLSFDDLKSNKRQKMVEQKMENWETLSKSFDGVGKVIFDKEDMTVINKALNMQTEANALSESQLMAPTPNESFVEHGVHLFNILDKDRLEMVTSYRDKYPCLNIRKAIMKVRVLINMIAFKIIKSSLFEGISLFVIMANSFTLMIEDPQSSTKSDFENSLDEVFLVLYTAEMAFKILGLGFLFNKGAYLRDTWNILDFVIVTSAYLEIILADPNATEEGGSGLAALRSFRVLRPLRTISGIEGLRIIVSSIISAMPLLFNTILVLMFFFIIFSIAGSQLFSGELKRRCVSYETGRTRVMEEDAYDFCGIRECGDGYFCGKTNSNPNYGASNFDTIFYGLLVVFQSVTLEGWSVFMVWIEQTYTTLSFIFFIPIVFIGAFFLLNLTLAVIKSQFTEEHNKKKKKRGPRKKRNMHWDEDEEGLTEEQKKERAQQREEFQKQALSKWRTAFIIKKYVRRLARRVEAKRQIKAEERRQQRALNGSMGQTPSLSGSGLMSPKQSQTQDGPKIKILNEKIQQNETIPEVDDEYKSDATMMSHSPMFAKQLLEKKITTVKGDRLIAPNGAKICGNTVGLQDKQDKRITSAHLSPAQIKGINNIITPGAQKVKPIYLSKQDRQEVPEEKVYAASQSPKRTPKPLDGVQVKPLKFSGMVGIRSNINGSVIQEDEDDRKLKKGKYQDIHKDMRNFLANSETEFFDSESETDPNIQSDNQGKRNDSTDLTNGKVVTRGRRRRDGRAERLKNMNTSASSLHDQTSRVNDSAKKGKRDPFGLKARAKSIPGYLNKSMRLQMKMPQKQRSGSPTQKPVVDGGLNHERLVDSRKFTTFNRDDIAILGWKKKLIVKKNNIEFFSADEVMIRSAQNKIVEEKKTRAAQTLAPYSRFMHYRPYEKLHKFKAYPPIEEEEPEEKPQEEGEDGEEQQSLGKSMNADLGLPPGETGIPQEQESQGKDIDEKVSQFDLPFLSKQIVTGTIAVVCTPRKFLLPSKAQRVKLLDQAIQRAEKSIEEIGEESLGAPSDRQKSREEPSHDKSKSFKKSFSQFDVEPVGPRGQSAQIPNRNLSRSGIGNNLNHSHESNSQSALKSIVAARTQIGLKRMQTMKSKLMGGKSDKRGAARVNKEREITDDDVIKVLNKEMIKSTLFYNMGKAIEEQEGQSKIDAVNNTTESQEMDHISESEEEEVDSLFASTIKDEYEFDPTDFLQRDVDCRVEVQKAKVDTVTMKYTEQDWSGQDVKVTMDPYMALISAEMISAIRIWPYKLHGVYKKGRNYIKEIATHSLFDNFMTLAVTCNTVTLALDRYGIPEDEEALLNIFNDYFTWIFICEMGLKILGLGVVAYLSDKMNYLDGAVVILSIVEMAFLSGSGGALSAFRTIRIFRTFRVLRVARLLRSMQSMQVIIGVIARSISSFAYLALLLILFIIIYALLGMQTYGGSMTFGPNWDDTPRTNFDHFHNSFVTCFQVLTMENWQYVMYDALRTDINKTITGAYFISWIFIGNFMLLNLFLAILLDSFVEEDEDNNTDKLPPEMQLEMERKRIEDLMAKQGSELINILAPQEMGGTKKKKGGFVKVKKKKKGNDKLLDESLEINLELLTKQMGSVKPKKPLYDGIEAEKSLFLFDKTWGFRILMYNISKSQNFDHIIMGLIVFSSLKLIVDTYMMNSTDETWILISKIMDWFLNVSFTLELMIKTIAMGFLIDGGSYIREFWNQLDAFIVFTSWIDQSFEGVDLPIIKIFRLLRTLRPLRFISHNPNLKAIVTALFESVGSIFNVTIVVLVVWLMFGILAVNMFGGKFQFCSEQEYTYTYQYACEEAGGLWLTRDSNFDSVPDAILSLFIVSNLEGWPDVMWSAVDSIDVEIGPKFDNTPLAAYFFIIFIFLGSFFFLNFFVGVIFLNFEEAQRQEKAALFMKDSEMKWVDIMKLIVKAKPDLETTNVPKNKFRRSMHAFITNGKVDAFIMVCIVLNMITMAMGYETQTASYTNFLNFTNYIFTGVFALEALIKLIGFGCSYFKSGWNRFDFFVVISSFIDLLMNMLDAQTLSIIRVGPQLARVLRVLRVTRLFRLLNKYKGLQALIQTIMFSLPSLMNVFGLLMLIYFLFAVLAVFLFGHIKQGGVVDDYVNFSNFGYAMLILIRASTGEDWNGIMYDTMRVPPYCEEGVDCGSSFSWIYFVFFLMICSLVMLNLFILVILQQFDEYYFPQDNIMERFKNDLETFKSAWTEKTAKYNCIKIKDRDLVNFFQSMEPRLGMKGSEEVVIIKNLVLMDLESDEEGYIYFNDLLFKSMKRIYGCQHIKNMLLADAELKTLSKLERLKDKIAKRQRNMERTSLNAVNPFLTRMFYRMTWRSWMTVWGNKKEQREYERREGFERENSGSDDDYDKSETMLMEEQTIGSLEEYNETIHENDDESVLSPANAGRAGMSNLFPPSDQMGSRTINSALSMVNRGVSNQKQGGGINGNDSDRKVDESSLLMQL